MMINRYFYVGNNFEALDLFVRMQMNRVISDLMTILVVIQACGEYENLNLGMQAHQLAN